MTHPIADHFTPTERREFDAQTAAIKAVSDWLATSGERGPEAALINCTPSMIAGVAVNAYKQALGCGHPNHGAPDHDCRPFTAAP